MCRNSLHQNKSGNLFFQAGVDGPVTVTESRVFKAGGAFFLIGKGAMVVYHLIDIVI